MRQHMSDVLTGTDVELTQLCMAVDFVSWLTCCDFITYIISCLLITGGKIRQ